MNAPVNNAPDNSTPGSVDTSSAGTSGSDTSSASYACFCQLGDLLGASDFLRQTRHQIHRNPELSFKEFATSELVATRLEEWGWAVTRNVGV